MIVKIAEHYDLLIEENNDPVHDSPALKAYMEQWDGPVFLNALKLSGDKPSLKSEWEPADWPLKQLRYAKAIQELIFRQKPSKKHGSIFPH